MPDTLVICQGQEPETLYSYGGSMLAMSHVLEAIYDGPIDTNSFSYQAVILEKLPSLADGDAVINNVTVGDGDMVVDDSGNVVTLAYGEGVTETFTIRPAGCASSDCAIEYAGEPVEMEQMVVTFKLKEGLMWSDGTPLTTADSVYAFNLQADPDTPTGKYTIERTASYEATDDVTAVWTGLPGYKDSTYFTNFFGPAPEHVWGQYTAAELVEAVDADALYVGWGPYIIDEWMKGDHISMHKNPNYWRADEGLPKFENLIYRFVGENSNANIAAILSGECDIVDQTSHLDDQSELLLELQAAGQVNPTFVTGTVWEHADFNIYPVESYDGFAGIDADGDGFGPFADPDLRHAVAMCMDRQAVVDTVMFGQSVVLDTYLPPEHPVFADTVPHYDFDPEAANALLESIGWVDDDGDPETPRVAQGRTDVPDGTVLEFSYGTTNATQRQQATQVMAESMAQCGIKVNLEYYPASEWFADGPDGPLFGRKFDLGQFAWLTGVEPSCDLYLTEAIPGEGTNAYTGEEFAYGWGGWNETGYGNEEYDLACNTAMQSLPGQDAYYENHIKAQEIFGRDLPVVPLYLRLKLAATRPDMCNFIMDPTANSEMWNIENFAYGPLCDQ
ncbi:MAG TPA: peptide ABC transporter substrate-binding protein [Anaerolineales bacterium]|nr:peptide ABC transporter substrate-binding protein [Anaerolineales bacterium]